MGLNCGIVGLPNVGKSTLFNAITKNRAADAANYPFCTIEPNVGRVEVPDERLHRIKTLIGSHTMIPNFLELVDIAGLVKGASKGEGLGNQFLGHIRQVDAIIHVVRCFEDSEVIHVDGSPDPKRDTGTINLELLYSDFELVNKMIEKLSRHVKSKDKTLVFQYECLINLKAHLEKSLPGRSYTFRDEDEELFLKSLGLITMKPVLYAANVSESDFSQGGAGNDYYKALLEVAKNENAQVVMVSAKIEEELISLNESEAKEYLISLGVQESGLDRLIREGYGILNLETFFTAGEKETRAWTFKKGMRAPEAASVIHTDFQKGFICAEVYSCDDLFKYNSVQSLKEAGLYRKEGKDYICRDGDIIHFLFNV